MEKIIASDNYMVHNARLNIKAELMKKKVLGLPISKTDKKTGLVYLEYADGHIEEIGYIRKGAYCDEYDEKT